MKVILSHGYFLHEDKAEQKIIMPYPPLGLLHVATYIRLKGIESKVFDSTFSSFNKICQQIEKENPQCIGLYVNLSTRVNIIRLIHYFRTSKKLNNPIIILGGPDVRYNSDQYLEKGADFCITGEGELTFYQLLKALGDGNTNEIAGIKGLKFKSENGQLVHTGEQDLIENLDDIPFPDFELIDLADYFKAWKSFHGFSSITISSMRGCPYQCRWCSKAVFGNTFRRRSTGEFVKEIKKLHEKYAPDRFWIVDDVFTINKTWLLKFKEEITKQKLKIDYECITRADRMDDEVISSLKESGCFRLWIGAESGSQRILDSMKREVEIEKVQEMIWKTKNAGIESGTFLMIGYPGEKEEDIILTAKHIKVSKPDHCTITLAYPIPGTEFHEEIQNLNLSVPGEWGTYTDREIDFKRTYKRRYYRYAAIYLHNTFKSNDAKNQSFIKQLAHRIKATIARILMIINK